MAKSFIVSAAYLGISNELRGLPGSWSQAFFRLFLFFGYVLDKQVFNEAHYTLHFSNFVVNLLNLLIGFWYYNWVILKLHLNLIRSAYSKLIKNMVKDLFITELLIYQSILLLVMMNTLDEQNLLKKVLNEVHIQHLCLVVGCFENYRFHGVKFISTLETFGS